MGLVLLIAVAAITLGVLGSFSRTSSRDVQLDAGAPVPGAAAHAGPPKHHHPAPAAPHASAAFARAPVTAAEVRLQTALGKAVRLAGPGSGALVEDLNARTTLYALHATIKRPPASVEKLYTTTALIRKLGPNARLHTAVLGQAISPAGSGTETCICAAAGIPPSVTRASTRCGTPVTVPPRRSWRRSCAAGVSIA